MTAAAHEATPYDNDIAPAAALIADPTRAAILHALVPDRPLAAGELARLAGVSAATASFHLAKLLDGGLIAVARQGRHRYYRLTGYPVAAALEAVRARRMDADRILIAVGLSPTLLQSPHARVSAEHYGKLWRLVASTLDDEFFGQDSRRMKSGSFAMLCHSVLSCRTLAHALERSLRFYGLILDDVGGSLASDDGEANIVLQ